MQARLEWQCRTGDQLDQPHQATAMHTQLYLIPGYSMPQAMITDPFVLEEQTPIR